MSKTDIRPEEITKGTLITVAVAAVAIVGIAVVALRKGPRDKGSQDPSLFENLAQRKPSGGRVTRRRDPRADGHATPLCGIGRVSTAPDFYSYK
ncbi:hypothetical protein FYJ43_01755 [Cutibacterium sp. WCA-380-WT-3A]|uniref:Uncharacterized protein n=2 Tax=Cutibacterium porci TaxID=2605781 RepID=A0A7K0J4D0_9ACTN|nr:hypothetical protein [Cutibacterium porci]